jgi:hypothetical protein
MGIAKSVMVLVKRGSRLFMNCLTALGNLHFPPVPAPEPDILDEHQGLDFANVGNAFVVFLKLRDDDQ